MRAPFENFRELFELIRQKHKMPFYWYVLAPWIEAHPGEREWLNAFGCRSGNPIPPAEMTELWSLYALSRVNDMLLLAFQQGHAGKYWHAQRVSLEEYLMFSESLGLRKVEVPLFSPFHHEIVEVEESADEHQPVTLEATIWPCLMLGEMMFSRAGVRVSGGRRFISAQLAASSLLYWTFYRKNRPCRDLSQGWGSNSQWGTNFRRDYHVGKELYYNVDGTRDLSTPVIANPASQDSDGRSRNEWIELLTNRCFIKTPVTDTDLWPYDHTLATTMDQ